MKKALSIISISVLVDQLTKYLIVKNLNLHQSIPIIRDIFHLTYIQNTGAGFGILKGTNSLLIWLTIMILGLILWNYDKVPDRPLPRAAIALIIAGAIGNLLSRIFFGYVIDFIDFRIWPAFNIADAAITIGAIVLVISLLKDQMHE